MTKADDPCDLERFVCAQEDVIETAMEELRQGRKTSHWMWFVFPQLAGLGLSAMSRRYAIRGLPEAKAYLAHDLLGPRLRDCARLVNAHKARAAHDIFGAPDDRKFYSSMTLFSRAADGESVFGEALDLFFEGARDVATLDRL